MSVTKFFSYVLELNAPAVFTKVGGDPNSAETKLFVPGASLRGAVAARVRNKPDWLTKLVLSEQVCYLNAYPEISGARALPTPVSFRRPKLGDFGNDILHYDDVFENNFGERPVPDDEQLERAYWPFSNWMAADRYASSPRVSNTIHHQRNRKIGTPGTSGTLFQYQSLQAGQRFWGLVSLSAESESDVLEMFMEVKKALSGSVFLGRSRSSEYGGNASIVFQDESLDVEVFRFQDDLNNLNLKVGNKFVAVLTSAYVGRDPLTGQICPSAVIQELENSLGKKAEVVDRCWEFELDGAYNATWGIPMPQHLSVAAGSVFVLEAKDNITSKELLQIESLGIGERRTDGFGRVLFLRTPTSRFNLKKVVERNGFEDVGAISDPILLNMQRRITREAVDPKVILKASMLAKTASGTIPPPSLLGRLRLPLRQSPKEAMSGLKETLRVLKRKAEDKLSACKIDGHPLDEWLIEATQWDKETLIRKANLRSTIEQNQIRPAKSSPASDMLDDEEAARLKTMLIDSMLSAMVRRIQKEGRNS